MKKLLIIMGLVFLSVFGSEAYGYDAILKDGKRWELIEADYSEMERRTYTIEVVGDTVFNGWNCKKCIKKRTQPTSGTPSTIYLTESNGVLLKIYNNSTGPMEQIYLDMNVEAGDRYYFYNFTMRHYPGWYTVVDTKTVDIFGTPRKCITVRENPKEGYWIEGVGATTTLIADCGMMPHTGNFLYIKACYEGDKCIYTSEEMDRIFGTENGFGGIFNPNYGYNAIDEVHIDGNAGIDKELYNLQGIRVTAPRSGQIYIRQGKKIIWP